jgi:hypothetical protein
VARLEFIGYISLYNQDPPQMLLSKPFLINRNSSAITITKFINERLDYMVDYYYLDDGIIQELRNQDGPVVLLNYSKFYI